MTNGQRVMALACTTEGVTGLLLLVAPSVLTKPLISSDIEGVPIIVANIAGMALLALAIACWPSAERNGRASGLALLLYNFLVAMRLAEAGVFSKVSGVLLWPVV